MKFWYFINGPDESTGKLSVAQRISGSLTEVNLWSNEIYINEWRYGQVSVNGGLNPFFTIFQATKSNAEVIIGIDDAILTLGYCAAPTSCDFESMDICSWTQMKDDQFDWLLQAGETDSHGTGPTVGKYSRSNERDIRLSINVFLYLQS